jgi:branched-subunit amino acid transport protein
MNTWIIMLSIGILTFATRLSFIALLERLRLPTGLQRALRFVPLAVLSAIIAPELAFYKESLLISPLNPRLVAGILATAVAYFTKNVVWTILAGMAALWILGIWL